MQVWREHSTSAKQRGTWATNQLFRWAKECKERSSFSKRRRESNNLLFVIKFCLWECTKSLFAKTQVHLCVIFNQLFSACFWRFPSEQTVKMQSRTLELPKVLQQGLVALPPLSKLSTELQAFHVLSQQRETFDVPSQFQKPNCSCLGTIQQRTNDFNDHQNQCGMCWNS